MKKILGRSLFFVLLFSTSNLMAQDAKTPQPYYKAAFGIEVFPAALTFKTMTTRKTALEFVGYFNDGFRVTVLSEYYGVLNMQKNLKWYIGGGGHIGFDKGADGGSAKLGVDGVLGLDYKFLYLPLDISVDWQPAFGIGDRSNFTSWGGVGVRVAL